MLYFYLQLSEGSCSKEESKLLNSCYIKKLLHCIKHKRGSICLSIPIQSVIIGEFEFEQSVIDTKYDVSHHCHQRAVKSNKTSHLQQLPKRIQPIQGWQEDCELGNYDSCCKKRKKDGESRVKPYFDTAKPQPFSSIDPFVLRRREQCGFYFASWRLQICKNIFNEKGLLYELFPSAFQSSQFKQQFFNFSMQFCETNFSKIWHISLPFFLIFVRDKIQNIVVLWRFSMSLLLPVKFFDLQLQFLQSFLFFICKSYCTELFLLKFDLILFLAPQFLGQCNQTMRQEDNHKEHTKCIGSCHEYWHEFLEIELVLQKEINQKDNAQKCEYSIDDEIVYESGFEFIAGSKLSCCFVLLCDGKKEPGQQEDGVVDGLPNHTHRVVCLQRMIDVVGQKHDYAETQQPRQVHQNLYCCAYFRHRVPMNQVSDVKESQHDLYCHQN